MRQNSSNRIRDGGTNEKPLAVKKENKTPSSTLVTSDDYCMQYMQGILETYITKLSAQMLR